MVDGIYELRGERRRRRARDLCDCRERGREDRRSGELATVSLFRTVPHVGARVRLTKEARRSEERNASLTYDRTKRSF